MAGKEMVNHFFERLTSLQKNDNNHLADNH
jgi:hypothetical protein